MTPWDRAKGLHLLHTMLPIQVCSLSKREAAGHRPHWELKHHEYN